MVCALVALGFAALFVWDFFVEAGGLSLWIYPLWAVPPIGWPLVMLKLPVAAAAGGFAYLWIQRRAAQRVATVIGLPPSLTLWQIFFLWLVVFFASAYALDTRGDLATFQGLRVLLGASIRGFAFGAALGVTGVLRGRTRLASESSDQCDLGNV